MSTSFVSFYLDIFTLEIKIKLCKIYAVFQIFYPKFSATLLNFTLSKNKMLDLHSFLGGCINLGEQHGTIPVRYNLKFDKFYILLFGFETKFHVSNRNLLQLKLNQKII